MPKISMILALLGLSIACTSLQTSQTPQSTCAHMDWFETGRADGRQGMPLRRFKEHEQRCASAANAEDYYSNGRNLGLVDFCSPAGALEAGKNGAKYEAVCPEHLEAGFLANYRLGQKIRDLEADNGELKERIENMTGLLSPSSPSNSLRAQIEQLKSRRAQNNSQISQLEKQAGTQL